MSRSQRHGLVQGSRITTMIPPAVVSRRRAPYTSTACNTCRRRRCKCDGVHPSCGTCSFYGHECSWIQEDVSQRPPTKQLVQSLRTRIRELEAELTQLPAGPISGPAEQANQENRAMSVVDPVTVTNETKEEFPRRSHLTMREGSISASGPTSMWSTFLDEPAPLIENQIPHPEIIYRYTFERNPSIPLHMQSQDIQMSERCEWDRYLPKLNPGIGFTRFEHDTLLYRCFNYHTPWLRTLEPDLFLRDMLLKLIYHPDNADTTKSDQGFTYYSPFLHCALVSLATAFSSDPGVRSKHVREQFARHAKQLLEVECERPTLTAIRGLLFLSEYHGSLGERELAYLYSGMSCRMVRALGLCINGRVMVERKLITEQELASRTLSFWALFCHDKLTSLEYGRDCDVYLPHLDVGLPTVDPIRDQRPWGEIQPTGSQGHTSRPNQASLVFFQGCRLMLIAIRIMDTVLVILWLMRYKFLSSALQAIFMAGATLLGRHVTLPGSASKQQADAHAMAQECIRTLRVAAQTWGLAQLYASQLEALLSQQVPRSSFDSYYPRSDAYEPPAPEHDETISRMFQDFIIHHDQDAEELGIPW
ncbi:hypothetical protein RSAG8_04007, partial [Rhizoctonia solani AG-8 WAC10335]